jgi:hypothetical protein
VSRLAVAGLALAVFVFVACSAHADLTVCSSGSGPGQCSTQRGSVATDTGVDRVYVADEGNNRIDVFEANEGEGKVKFLFSFGGAHLSDPRQVAVDNDPASPSQHDVYVYDASQERVKRFHENGAFVNESAVSFHIDVARLATGFGGDLYVGETLGTEASGFEPRLVKLDPELKILGECEVPHEDLLNKGLAVGPAGEIYASFNKDGGVFRFGWAEPVCSAAGAPYPLTPNVGSSSLAVDGAGDLFAAQALSGVKAGELRAVARFDSAGNIVRRYGFGSLPDTLIEGVAPLASVFGNVFVSYPDHFQNGAPVPGGVVYLKEPAVGSVVASLEAVAGNVRATLKAEVDPEGGAGTHFRFEFMDQKAWEAAGDSFVGAKSTPVMPLPGPADFELWEHLANVQVGCADPLSEVGHPGETALQAGECLIPQTAYRYRIDASNLDGAGNSPVEGSFETQKPLELEDAFVSEVGSDSARVSARVDPFGIPTTGFFEYVTDAQFRQNVEGLGTGHGFDHAVQVPDVAAGAGRMDFGAGAGAVTRSIGLSLDAGTGYHVRFKATDPLIEKGLVPGIEGAVLSNEMVFETLHDEVVDYCGANEAFRTGFSALLPGCRAYEMVSPLDKEGGDIFTLTDGGNYPDGLTESSLLGGKLAYASYRAFGDASAAPITAQYIAARSSDGWRSHYVLGPREGLNTTIGNARFTELRALSPDLCEAWVKTFAEPVLAPKALAGQMNIYRHDDSEQDCGGEGWEAFTTVLPAHGGFGNLELRGVAADGSQVIYAANDNLEDTRAPDLGGEGEKLALYYEARGEGKPTYVCVGVDGSVANTTCDAGSANVDQAPRYRLSNLTGAISADGERVFWSTPVSTASVGGQIFVREHPGQAQSTISAGKCLQASKACTVAVSAKGEELTGGANPKSHFWLASEDGSKAIYTTVNGQGRSDLYEFGVDTRVTRMIAGKVLGVMGAGSDASRIYFASEEALSGEANSQGALPTPGKANLYLTEGDTFRFVATLADAGGDPVPGENAIIGSPAARSSRVSTDGLHAVFMSTMPLTGYENTDAHSPAKCGQTEGRCDTEVFLFDAAANENKGTLTCVSCNPSRARPSGRKIGLLGGESFWEAAWIGVWKTSLYPGRVMSEDGTRVFYEAADALSPRDSNGSTDVYEWEAPNTHPDEGDCRETSASYSVQDKGCVNLISSGQGEGGATLVDTNQNGSDVFLATAQSLLHQDTGLVDIYDARIDGGLPELASSSAGCEGEACQAPAVAPLDATPGSLTFTGPGDPLVQPVAQIQSKKKGLTRAQQFTRALKECRSKPKRKQATCRVQARKRYAAGNAKKTSNKHGGRR